MQYKFHLNLSIAIYAYGMSTFLFAEWKTQKALANDQLPPPEA